jgi:hypothetical protein
MAHSYYIRVFKQVGPIRRAAYVAPYYYTECAVVHSGIETLNDAIKILDSMYNNKERFAYAVVFLRYEKQVLAVGKYLPHQYRDTRRFIDYTSRVTLNRLLKRIGALP